jgi:hypothetical protein
MITFLFFLLTVGPAVTTNIREAYRHCHPYLRHQDGYSDAAGILDYTEVLINQVKIR